MQVTAEFTAMRYMQALTLLVPAMGNSGSSGLTTIYDVYCVSAHSSLYLVCCMAGAERPEAMLGGDMCI